MSGSASITLEQAILGHTLGFAQMAFRSPVYVALCSASMPPSETVQGIEAFGGGYTRMRATFALIDTPANIAANTASIEWPIATASWGTLGYFELWDAAVGGNRLYWGQFSPATPVTVSAGDIVRFSAGNLAVQASSGAGGTTSIGAYLPLAGGALSGALMLASDPTTYLQAATKQYVDAHSGSGGGPGFLPLSGGTMLGTLSLAGNATLPLQAVPLQQLQNGPVISVLDHGAKGDGTTDDTAAIQNALTAYAGKATVLIPPTGSNYIVQQINLPSNTDLVVNGYLLLKAGTILGGTGILDAQTKVNITILGYGTIDGNNTVSQSACVNIGTNSSNIRISDITLRNANYWNLNIGASTNVRVHNVSMIGGKAANEFAAGCDNCWLTNCYINGPTQDEGFSFYGGVTNSGAIGNTVLDAGAAGISVLNDSAQTAPCKNIIISGNVCYNCYYGGISVDQGTGGTGAHSAITISGNRTYNNNRSNGAQGSEINVNYAGSVIISDNMVSDTSQYSPDDIIQPSVYGIYTTANCTDVTITGNSVFNIGNSARPGYGVYIGSTNVVQVSNNTFHDYRSPTYMTGIAGTAGIQNSYTNNLFGRLTANINFASIQPDTAIFNPSAKGLSFGAALPTNAATDAAAASAGVPVGGIYRNASVLMVRVV